MKPVPEGLKPYAIDPDHEVDRYVYYTLKGEEWRVQAMEFLWEAGTAVGGGGWNEHHERLEGMLFGYEHWQNNWWIEEANRKNGGIGGLAFCCAVDAEGLEWMRLAGYRALPPVGPDEFQVRLWERDSKKNMADFLTQDETSVALARFKVSPKAQRDLFCIGRRMPSPFVVRRDQVPEINFNLVRQIDIVLTR